MSKSAGRVVVLGAGVLGLSIASELAGRGVAPLVLSLTGGPRAASLRSFAWLNSFATENPAYHELRLLGLRRHRALAAALRPDWIAFPGALALIDPADQARLERLEKRRQASGYPLRRLSAAEAAALDPAYDLGTLAGHEAVFAPEEGWIDLPPFLDHLEGSIRASGGTLREISAAPRLLIEGGRLVGLQVGPERIAAETLVVAAGAATPGLLRQAGFEPPASSNRALLLRARAEGAAPRLVLRSPKVAIRPQADGLLTLHAEAADAAVSGGAEEDWRAPPEVLTQVLNDARALLSGRPELTLVSAEAGARPIPGDGFPIVGPAPGVSGLQIAFSHSGATLAPILAELLAAEILGEAPSPLLAEFRPDRFAPASAA